MPGYDKFPETISSLAVMRNQTRWSPEDQADKVDALIDYAFLCDRRMAGSMSISDAAKRWGRSRNFARAVVAQYESECQVCGIVAKDRLGTRLGTPLGTCQDVTKQQVTDSDGQGGDRVGTGSGQVRDARARGLLSDPDPNTDPDTHSRRAGEREDHPKPNFPDQPPPSIAHLPITKQDARRYWNTHPSRGVAVNPLGDRFDWPEVLSQVPASEAEGLIDFYLIGSQSKSPDGRWVPCNNTSWRKFVDCAGKILAFVRGTTDDEPGMGRRLSEHELSGGASGGSSKPGGPKARGGGRVIIGQGSYDPNDPGRELTPEELAEANAALAQLEELDRERAAQRATGHLA